MNDFSKFQMFQGPTPRISAVTKPLVAWWFWMVIQADCMRIIHKISQTLEPIMGVANCQPVERGTSQQALIISWHFFSVLSLFVPLLPLLLLVCRSPFFVDIFIEFVKSPFCVAETLHFPNIFLFTQVIHRVKPHPNGPWRSGECRGCWTLGRGQGPNL